MNELLTRPWYEMCCKDKPKKEDDDKQWRKETPHRPKGDDETDETDDTKKGGGRDHARAIDLPRDRDFHHHRKPKS
jgi:hypothetical protein